MLNKSIHRWFTLGLEEHSLQKDVISKYEIALAKENLIALQGYAKASILLFALVSIMKCCIYGIRVINILPGVIGIVIMTIVELILKEKRYTMRLSYCLTTCFNLSWYAFTAFFDIYVQPSQPGVSLCLSFVIMCSLFNSYPKDNIIGNFIVYFIVIILELIYAPIKVVEANACNILIAMIVGIFINQRNTYSNINKQIYTSMYKTAAKISILVSQFDIEQDSFNILQCPDYMTKVLLGNTKATITIDKIRQYFVSEEYQKDFFEFMNFHTLSKRFSEAEQLHFYFLDFRKKWCELILIEEKRISGKTRAGIAIVRDIDKEKRKEFECQEQLQKAVEESRKANEAKTNFLSRMSHDIRTPLNGIIGLLQINEVHSDDINLIQANQKKMMISANYLLSLINDVLQMSKLESGELVFAHEPMDLGQLAIDVVTIVQQRTNEQGITLEYEQSFGELKYPYVYGSPLHIRQIFLNIYGNAIKYNKAGGKVKTDFTYLGVKDGVVTYRWEISDTGIGMSKEFLKNIFEPFSQERTDARSVYNGTGLGMSIVKNLIDKMNGTIEVRSKEGVGSTFIITLSFEIASESEIIKPEQLDTQVSIRGLHLLIAEDNELNAEIAQMLFEDEGVSVEVVSDGEQAIDKFLKEPENTYDAILMDIMMPKVDGIIATKHIRKLNRKDAKTIPIIAMTANAFDEDAKECIEAGMNAHLSKPLELDKVITTIARCCKNK